MAQDGIPEALTFDDVLLLPAESAVLPAEVDTGTRLTNSISLNIPLVSAAMDTVTESGMAIAMAQAGGIGVIHRNMSAEAQAAEVYRVKRFESGLVLDPVSISPDSTIGELRAVKSQHGFSGFPVVDDSGTLAGIITNRDIRFVSDDSVKVSTMMTTEVVTVPEHVDPELAKKLLHQHRIERLIVVDDDGGCAGMMTVLDIQRSRDNPKSCKDSRGRLRVAAATGTGDKGVARALALYEADADAVVIDTAHGHSHGVIDAVRAIREQAPEDAQIIAGNIATGEAAEMLIEAGADAVKVGIGPGSICTTRIVSGVGVPQLTAVQSVVEVCSRHGIPVIADGGIKYSGDIAKAIAAGADSVMAGSLLAGTDESPGEIILYQGRSYKVYRGMGSLGAMSEGAHERYFQSEQDDTRKYVPEGIEGRVPARGPVENALYQMIGGLRSSMGYTGNGSIAEMKVNCNFVRITNAGLSESHVHDIEITREAPNYRR
ncbi:MAG: IMP dehydrogenase [Candidatus Thalassarchaeum betae]|uniref:Inosine-5'-monophosphate dehydrogenase n=1 Tax=Candidatus Thalassarchaeum betae TaxID=2599289 RepID=A0A2V3HRC8_9ARCH|nr:MAG: IMP dehydrogenase [Candidatus Thalassoarchaea betae]PXF24530.1 MAG: IMP dehydrogenase [Euryarchaeota archaeon]HIM13525.1 IMP dehydrogenase [Candidatus Poseidoniales archaeon]HIM92560.1 IMP dehydrogenase [Candidatus Poseidoniales archaeon]